jgi:thiol-disulfide isomerase/thioredoxin
MRRSIALAVSAAAAVLLSACGAGPTESSEPGTGAGRVTPPADAREAFTPLPAVALDGDEFVPESLAGSSVVLWFWAPWCTICRAEGPGVADVAAELEGEVTFIGVPGLGAENAMREFVDDTGTGSLTHLPDVDGQTWRGYEVVSQPAFAFVTPSGVVQTFNGALGSDKLRDAAESLTVDSA